MFYFPSTFSHFAEGMADEQLKTIQWLSPPTQWPEQWELQTSLQWLVGHSSLLLMNQKSHQL
jgi:hypothetical protein